MVMAMFRIEWRRRRPDVYDGKRDKLNL